MFKVLLEISFEGTAVHALKGYSDGLEGFRRNLVGQINCPEEAEPVRDEHRKECQMSRETEVSEEIAGR